MRWIRLLVAVLIFGAGTCGVPVPAGAAPPTITSFTGSASGNVVTLTWATTGAQGLGFLYGDYRYANSFDPENIGLVGSSGTVSFRVSSGGVHAFTLSVRNGLEFATRRIEVEVATPPVPRYQDPVRVDPMDLRALADGATAAELTVVPPATPPTGSYQIMLPSAAVWQSLESFLDPAHLVPGEPDPATIPLSAGVLRQEIAALAHPDPNVHGDNMGPWSLPFKVRSCNLPTTSATIGLGTSNIHLCSEQAVATVHVAPDAFDEFRVLVAPDADPVQITWEDPGVPNRIWHVHSSAFGLDTWTSDPEVTLDRSSLPAGQFPVGVHTVELMTCEVVTWSDFDCANLDEVRASHAGKVLSVVGEEELVHAGAPLVEIDTDLDDHADHVIVSATDGTVGPGAVHVAVDDVVSVGAPLVDVELASPTFGGIRGSIATMRVDVGDHADWAGPFDVTTAFDVEQIPAWTNPSTGVPLDLVAGDGDEIWTLGEYQRSLGRLHEVGGQTVFTRYDVPLGLDAQLNVVRPFGSTASPSLLRKESGWGESIVRDELGRVYAAQGGTIRTNGTGNHSRIARFEPGVDTEATPDDDGMCMVNMPGSNNHVSGLAWDAGRDRLWVAEYRAFGTPVLSSFDPDELPCENLLDYSQPSAVAASAHQYCIPPDTTGCISMVPLTGFQAVGHVAVDDEGRVWFTQYISDGAAGAALGRYDPDTGLLLKFPTPTGSRPTLAGSGAWQLRVDDDHVYLNEYFDADILRFDRSRAEDEACRSLVSGQNPCMEELRVPVSSAGSTVHSLELHDGKVWFTLAGAAFPNSGTADPDAAGIGFVDIASWDAGAPTGTIYKGLGAHVAGARAGVGPADLTGLAFDSSGRLVVADYWRRQLLRLTPT
jgi:hypothetical protein